MKKLLSILFVAMFAMASMVCAQSTSTESSYFIVKNTTTNETIPLSLDKFIDMGDNTYVWYIDCSQWAYEGEKLEITYKSVISFFTPYLTWYAGCPTTTGLIGKGTGLTKVFTIEGLPSFGGRNYTVNCNYKVYAQSSTSDDYIINFTNIKSGSRVTAKNSEASKVQVTYADYEEVASAGQRATVALYDIYGNPVSTGYLDGLGMCTLSTKGKPGIYIVKVTMNNQVIYNQRIQVK